jgi:hypothetical protein
MTVHAQGDDGLFERILDAATGDGAGAELYERRGALLELTETRKVGGPRGARRTSAPSL